MASGHAQGCKAPLRISGPVTLRGSELGVRVVTRTESLGTAEPALCAPQGLILLVLGNATHVFGETEVFTYLVQYVHSLLML